MGHPTDSKDVPEILVQFVMLQDESFGYKSLTNGEVAIINVKLKYRWLSEVFRSYKKEFFTINKPWL